MPKTALHISEIKKDKISFYAAQRNMQSLQDAAVDQIIDTVLAAAKPQGIFEHIPYDIPSRTFFGNVPFTVAGEQILPFLEQTETVVAMAATLGADVDRQIDAFFVDQHFTEGMLFDCVANAALDELLNRLTKIIDITYAADRYKTAWRVCPGEGDFPLSQQEPILHILNAPAIGITVSPSHMITPRKTATALSGLSSLQSSGCSGCAMHGHCGEEEAE